MTLPGKQPSSFTEDLTLASPGPSARDDSLGLTGDLGKRFHILALLGRGGMGEVYSAEDLTLGRQVALKAIRPERRLAPVARERFQREARLLSRLDHPGICRIHDIFEAEGRDFLVLELIEGRTLRQLGNRLDVRTRLDIALQIARVLEAAHAEAVVHRDLKPDNIMLTPEDQVKVLDFGLARDLARGQLDSGPDLGPQPSGDSEETMGLELDVTRGGVVMGTPAYLSPEQACGEPATSASDMYSFGLVLQRLFTGQRAYEKSDSVEEILEKARVAETRPVTGIDRDLAKLLERLKSRSPANRPTAVEACQRLEWIMGKPARRLRRWLATAAVLVVLAAGGKYMLDLQHERSIADRHRAEAEDLVEFMLGDLRERLEPVGRLDVLDEVGDRALAYFAARSADERTDADHHRFARAMNQIGEVRLDQGNLAAAREAFGQARQAAGALVLKDSQQGKWLFTLGESEFWLGNVALEEGDIRRAESGFNNYLAVAEKLVKLDPVDPAWQRELGYAHTNLAAILEAQGKTSPARRHFDQSISIKRALLAAEPENQGLRRDLINTLAWQGRVLLVDGDLRTAHGIYAQAVAEAKALVAHDPSNMPNQELLSSVLHLNGSTTERFGDEPGSKNLYLAGLMISRDLVKHDPSNTTWRLSLAVSQTGIGLLEFRSGSLAAAESQLSAAENLVDTLMKNEPGANSYWLQSAEIRLGLARVQEQLGNIVEAETHLSRAIAEARAAHEVNDDLASAEILARCLVLWGEIRQENGKSSEASDVWLEAEGLLKPMMESNRVDSTRVAWMRLNTLLGNVAEARSVSNGLQADGYARQDFERFRVENGI